MGRIGLGFVGDYNCRDIIRYTRIAEENGYESVWVSEDLGFRDSIAPLACLAVSTERIRLATGIVPIYHRPPALMAMTIATLDEVSRGRMILGLGSGVRSYVEKQGIQFRQPLTTLEEYVSIIRRMLAGESLNYRSHLYNLSDAKLSFKPMRQEIPIYIAARGPKMFQLAGKIADGALMSDGFCSPNYIRWALRNMRIGAEKAGGSSGDIDLASFMLLSVSEDCDQAKENVKPHVISLLAGGALDSHLHTMDLSTDELDPTREAWLSGDRKEACVRVPDTLMDACAVYGTPEQCAYKMKELRSAGIGLPVIVPVGSDFEETIEAAKRW